MNNLFNTINENSSFFDNTYIDTKVLFAKQHKQLPNIKYVSGIDGESAYHSFKIEFTSQILETKIYRWYNHSKKRFVFDRTVLILKNKIIIEFDEDYCEICFLGDDNKIKEIETLVLNFKERIKKEPQEINLVVSDSGSLSLVSMEIKKTKLSLDLMYEDDFNPVHQTILKRLNKKNDKGIVLLHGLPGTGKTTYIRYLVGKLKKKVLFLSPNVAGELMNPSFIRLLINNPNSILIIEDAENIIMDRKYTSNASVSNLLNVSDGLLADFLNVQIICTFNSELTYIDSALLRKGRLIAKYDFGKLSVQKANALSKHLKLNRTFNEPKTIAEITNTHEAQAKEQKQIIGFRSPQLELAN